MPEALPQLFFTNDQKTNDIGIFAEKDGSFTFAVYEDRELAYQSNGTKEVWEQLFISFINFMAINEKIQKEDQRES